MLSHFSRVWLFMTPWTVALQAPLSMEFSRQEYWNGLPCPPLGDLPSPGMELVFTSPALAGRFFTTSTTWWGKEVLFYHIPRSEVKWNEVAQSCPTLCATPWTVAYQAPSSMGFSRQDYWSGLPRRGPDNFWWKALTIGTLLWNIPVKICWIQI